VSTFRDRVVGILADVECPPYEFDFMEYSGGRGYLQARLYRMDIDTGNMGWGKGGLYPVDGSMSDDTIVKRCFVAARDYAEHEVREAFLWRGRRVLGPHVPLQVLWEALGDQKPVVVNGTSDAARVFRDHTPVHRRDGQLTCAVDMAAWPCARWAEANEALGD